MNAPITTETAAAASAVISAPNDFERLLQQESAYNPRDLLAGDGFDKMMRLAEVMSKGIATVPKHLQGNVGDCLAVITQAMQWNFNPFAVAQKTHIVNGFLGYEAQLVIAALNASPLLASRIDWIWSDGWNGVGGGDDRDANHWCEAHAYLRGEKTPRVLRVSMAQVGNVRNSPLWKADARQQLAYLAAKRWGRLHAPDVILGVYTPDEIQYDFGEVPPPAAPAPEKRGPQRRGAASTSTSSTGPAPTESAVAAPAGQAPAADGSAQAPAAAAKSTAPAPAGAITGGEVAYLRNKLKAAEISEASICDRFQVASIELLNPEQFATVKRELLAAQ